MRNSINNKVVLVTGASSGIGRATAITLADAGAKVALVARRADQIKALEREILDAGGEAKGIVADVGVEGEALDSIRQTIDMFGTIHALVNNAGILRPGCVEEQEIDEWRDTININLMAPVCLTKAVLPLMREQGFGHIVNISSNAAKVPGDVNLSAYGASKYGLGAFSASLRKEVAEHGIRVSLILPGTTETEVADSIPNDAHREFMESCIHKDSVLSSGNIAEAIAYVLCQPKNVNVNELWITPTYQ